LDKRNSVRRFLPFSVNLSVFVGSVEHALQKSSATQSPPLHPVPFSVNSASKKEFA
jgi:hypothetical protein